MLIKISIFFQIAMAEYQYPVSKVNITSSFGESRGDHFHNGIDLAGSMQSIFPIAEGTVLFYRNIKTSVEKPLMGCGNFVVVEHKQGIRSYYYHLSSTALEIPNFELTKQDILGLVGNTGRSSGPHLHLIIEDTKRNRIINPMLLLPHDEDKLAPKIFHLSLKVHNDRWANFKDKVNILRYGGKIQFYVTAKDVFLYKNTGIPAPKSYGERGVKRVSFYVDGGLVRSYDFDYLFEDRERLRMFPDYGYMDIYNFKSQYFLGDFVPKLSSHIFEVECEDWVGNSSRKSYKIIFR